MAHSTPIFRDAALPKTYGLKMWNGCFPKEMGYIYQKKGGIKCQSDKTSNFLLQYLSKVYWVDLILIVNKNNGGTLEKGEGLNEFFGNRLLTACFLLYFGNNLLFFPELIPLALWASIILAGGK